MKAGEGASNRVQKQFSSEPVNTLSATKKHLTKTSDFNRTSSGRTCYIFMFEAQMIESKF